MIKKVRVEKVDKKNGVICLVSMLFPELWSLNCQKSKVYIYASEQSHYALSENGIVYYAMTYYFRLGFEVEEFC